jgi:glycosyltransferase involved in cell wall biosynthesis
VLAADAVVARSVDRTIVVAPPLLRFLVQRLHVPGDRVVHIDNGLVLPPAAPPAGPVRRLLFVGLLVERKGVHLLLDALDLAARQGLPDDVTLTVAGDGPQRGALERQAQALGLSGRVRFLGFRTDVPDLLAQSDAFVLPSLMEQQPLVLIEALGAGLPTLATAVGGVADLVGDVGLVVTAGDRGSLADGLVRLSAVDGAAIGAAAARRARERFSLDHCVRAHLNLYADLQRWRPPADERYVRPDDPADSPPAPA